MISYAHPDDESFAGAGLAMQCHAAGIQTVLVTATHGQRGKTGDPPVCQPEELAVYRERELARPRASSDSVLCTSSATKTVNWTEAPPDRIRHALVSLIRQHRPVVLLTFDPNGFNAHPDHVAMGRFTMDAVSAAEDPRWAPDAGAPHSVRRVLWTPPTPPWEAGRVARLDAEPGVDFLIDISAWKERKAAALRAHKTQHLSIDRYFFGQPDLDRLLSVEIYRQGWGPPLERRPSGNVFEGIRSD